MKGNEIMLEILKFIFSSFWIFIGTLCLIPIIGAAVAMPIAAIRGGDINFRLIGENGKSK
jgi:hypothetical protein